MVTPSKPHPLHTFDSDYFPARIDHSLNSGRYKILRRLGEGVSSSAWLVHDEHGYDERGERRSRRYLAAKILTATRQHDAEALEHLHDTHIVHTDVKLDNVLFTSGLLTKDAELHRYLELNPVEIEGEAQLDGQIYPLVKAQPIPPNFTWDLSPCEAELISVYLIDLGQAQRAGEQPAADCFYAFALRAPETILQSDFGPGVDIWAVGCLTFELLVGRWLFHPKEDEGWTVEDGHLAKMMEFTGRRFPPSMLDRAHRRKEFFNDAGNLLRIPELVPISLETAMANYKIPGLSEDEIKKAADFIRACLRFDYTERATAKELQKHAFLADAFKC